MTSADKAKTWTSMWTVYIVWGSTYAAIAITVKSMPALLAMGLRFIVAAALLAGGLLIRKGINEFRVPRLEVLNAAIFGSLMLGLSMGAVSLAEHTVPSGIAALISCCLPLWVSLFRGISGDRPKKLTVLGIVIGFVGVTILIRPSEVTAVVGSDHSKLWLWVAVVVFGNFCWSLGTFLAPKYSMPKNFFILTFYQMLFGGIFLIIVGLLTGEKLSDFSHSTSSSWLAWFYLVVFGSLWAYSAFAWLVTNVRVSLVATYAYVNPLIAVLLGGLLLKEKFHSSELFGGMIVIISVILVVTAESRRTSSTSS